MRQSIIGITGRTGSGKSMACEWIKTTFSNVEHVDCDHIGHLVLEYPHVKNQLIKEFGPGIESNGKINRPILRQIVFSNSQKLTVLNDVVHPKICDQVNQIIQATHQSLILVEGALIHKVGLEHLCTHTICIDSPTTAILNRRPENQQVLAFQPKANDYMNMCHHTIKNNGSIDHFHHKISQLFHRLGL